MAGLAEILDENARLRAQLEALQAKLSDTQTALSDTRSALTQTRSELSTRDAMLAVVQARVDELEQAMALLEQQRRGPASQRYVADEQEVLPFVTADVEPPPRRPQVEDTESGRTPAIRRKRGTPRRRNRDSLDHLPRRTVRCVAADDACVRCGGALKVIGQAESFRVNWVPGQFVVEELVRDKCACPSCPGEGVLTVPGPYALDRALCADGLLARVIVDKFADHIPLNRQAKRMAREGFDVGSNTLAGWVCAAGGLLSGIAAAVLAELLDGPFLQTDDTGMPVQDGGNGALRKGRLWAITDQQQVVYQFTETKKGVWPLAFLDGFAGDLLVVDGGSEFNQVVREQGLIRGGCWSHLRKRFFEARLAHPGEAHLALCTIRDLFEVERELWGQDAEAIRIERQRIAKPLVDGFFAWVKASSQTTRPQGLLGKAFGYALNQEQTLRAHLEHGEIPMHNNLSELMLRQAVVGRKNWLFARSQGGAEVAAAMYTLVGSCMLQGLDPQDYLVDVLGRVQDHSALRLEELTPRSWRLARERHA